MEGGTLLGEWRVVVGWLWVGEGWLLGGGWLLGEWRVVVGRVSGEWLLGEWRVVVVG